MTPTTKKQNKTLTLWEAPLATITSCSTHQPGALSKAVLSTLRREESGMKVMGAAAKGRKTD